jgi:hypothetical protein
MTGDEHSITILCRLLQHADAEAFLFHSRHKASKSIYRMPDAREMYRLIVLLT